MEDTDLVYAEDIQREFISIHASSSQRWYYISDQMQHEHVLFRQAKLADDDHSLGVPHASFPIAHSEGERRESIEVKLLIIYLSKK